MTLRRHMVLVVEDEEPQQELLQLAFEGEGVRVVTVSDGETALHLLKQLDKVGDQFCVMVLDLVLPRFDGLRVLHSLQEQDRSVPVIAMSSSNRLLTEAETAGARVTLSKPYDLDALLTEVERHCARPHG
jgi:CheY-like chemotaxis protein